jgi:hypothetical protein
MPSVPSFSHRQHRLRERGLLISDPSSCRFQQWLWAKSIRRYPESKRSARTVLSRLLKALIDPNAAPVRSLSREERELMIAANNGYLLAFDNLCGLPVWLSDSLCRLATGGRRRD